MVQTSRGTLKTVVPALTGHITGGLQSVHQALTRKQNGDEKENQNSFYSKNVMHTMAFLYLKNYTGKSMCILLTGEISLVT